MTTYHQPQQRLVNKQFNSPIGLYSEQNIKEVMERDAQVLANGAVGVNFHNTNANKPSNLQNSAVMRMLEEEEYQRQRGGKMPNMKRVAWPPPNEESIEYESDDVVDQQSALQTQGAGPIPSSNWPINNHFGASETSEYRQSVTQNDSAYASTFQHHLPPQTPISPPLMHSPAQTRPSPAKQWAPVSFPSNSPSCGTPTQQPSYTEYVQNRNFDGTPIRSQQAQHPSPRQKSVEPPPTTIALRKQAPISQTPSPLFKSQPVTINLKGGANMRGDKKWPPENVKRQVAEENRARIELAKGPAFRPLAVRKDYGPFFAQHALPSTYPAYKPPPGTQFI